MQRQRAVRSKHAKTVLLELQRAVFGLADEGQIRWREFEVRRLAEPNRVGRTMIWSIKYPGMMKIRCFMPGAMM